MKRIFSLLTVVFILISSCIPAFAAEDDSRNYQFDLNAGGSYEVQAAPGDIITLTLRLKRTDSQDPAKMYAMQDEINYDNTFFELVEGGSIVASGIEQRELVLRDNYNALYMNYVDMNGGGQEWAADTMVGTFQLRVMGTSGSSTITNKNCAVSKADGSGSYTVSTKDVTVVISRECTITFESNGGTAVPEQTVALGDKISKPEDPTKEGLFFAGWYKDIDLQEEWNFGKDTVNGNMTLYAKWADGTQPSGFFQINPLVVVIVVLILLILLLLLVLWRIFKNRQKYYEDNEPLE